MTMLLTAYGGVIIGPIAKIFGTIMNWIFQLGVTNLGLDIILFTLVIYILMLPLTIKQQKFSKMSAQMNPEIKAVQEKYKGRKDEASVAAMQEETKEIYEKYGSSPTAGCLPLLIQMPVLLSLYRVIWNIPAYVPSFKAIYNNHGLVDMIQKLDAEEFIAFAKTLNVKISEISTNTAVDVLWKLQNSSWETLKSMGSGISGFAEACASTQAEISKYTYFLGFNIAESPLNMLKSGWVDKHYGMIVIALMIPILAGVTQYVNMKLSSTSNGKGGAVDEQAKQLEGMNKTMPLISVFFVVSLPSGLGLYWIAGAVIRSIQQVAINKYLDTKDMTAEIEKRKAKALEKKKKSGLYVTGVEEKAKKSAKSISYDAANKPSPTRSGNVKAGSLASKANMVKEYNERNKK